MEPESELVEKAMSGDRAAVERLLLLYYDRVLRFIRSEIPSQMSSALHPEDVLQQTYLKAFRRVKEFHPKSEYSFYAWLKKIAKHQLLDEIRRSGKDPMGPTSLRRAPRPEGTSDTVFGISQFLEDGEKTPSEAAKNQELMSATQVALAALEPHYQEAIRLRYLENRSAEETAEIMGMGADQLRGILFRARQRLKQEIGRLSLYI